MLCNLGYGLSPLKRPVSSVALKQFELTSSLPSEFTYTRTGTQTVRNSSGQWVSVAQNTAPFDHTGAGVPLGLRFEPPRTNKTTQRNFAPTDTAGVSVISGTATISVFDYANVSSASIRGASIAPLTNGKVIRIVNGTGTSVIQIGDAAGNTNAHSWRVCLAAPSAGAPKCNVAFSDGLNIVEFNPASANTWTELTRENVTPNNAARYLRISVYANQEIYLIGTQLEEGAFLTSPIVTNGANATRGFPVCVALGLGAGAVPWFNTNEGTIVCEAMFEQLGFDNQYVFMANEGTGLTNAMGLYSDATLPQIYVRDIINSVNNNTDQVHHPIPNKRMPMAMSWKDGESMAVAGPMRFERRSRAGSPVNMDRIYIGGRAFSNGMCGWVRSLSVMNKYRSLSQIAVFMFPSSGTYRAVASGGQSNKHGWFRSQVGNGNQGERNAIARMDLRWTATENWLINGAENGSFAIKANDPNSGNANANWWYDPVSLTFGHRMADWEEMVVAFGVSRIQAYDWDQGESDSNSSLADLKQAYLEIFNRMRAVAGEKPVFVTLTGRRSDAEILGYNTLRRAYRELAAENSWIHLLPEKITQPLADIVHLTDAGYGAHGTMAARKMLSVLGEAISGPVDGPSVTFSRSGPTLTGTISYPAGGASDFTGGAVGAFAFLNNGTPITLSNFTKVNATTFTLTLASVPTGTQEVYYIYGSENALNATFATDFIRDNSSQALPLRSAYQVL